MMEDGGCCCLIINEEGHDIKAKDTRQENKYISKVDEVEREVP